MKKIRITFIAFILFFLVFFLMQCGLPDGTTVNLNQLNKPTVKVYNNKDSIFIEIEGYYPQSDYPDFEGYNIYIGDNNESGQIIKRVLYIDDDNLLPSKKATRSSTGIVSAQAEISKFQFRFTSSATTEDLETANVTRDDFLERNFVIYERYYFIVKAKETSREGIASDSARLVIIDYKETQTLTYSLPPAEPASFSFVDTFKNLKINAFEFYQDNDSIEVATAGFRNNIFEYPGIPKDNASYFNGLLIPYASNVYFAKKVTDNDTQYLKIFIHSIQPNSMTISYGYEKEILTNLDIGFNKIN